MVQLGTQNVETCKALRKSMRDNYTLSQRLNYIELNMSSQNKIMNCCIINVFFCRDIHTILSHLRAHAFARSVTVAMHVVSRRPRLVDGS